MNKLAKIALGVGTVGIAAVAGLGVAGVKIYKHYNPPQEYYDFYGRITNTDIDTFTNFGRYNTYDLTFQYISFDSTEKGTFKSEFYYRPSQTRMLIDQLQMGDSTLLGRFPKHNFKVISSNMKTVTDKDPERYLDDTRNEYTTKKVVGPEPNTDPNQ